MDFHEHQGAIFLIRVHLRLFAAISAAPRLCVSAVEKYLQSRPDPCYQGFSSIDGRPVWLYFDFPDELQFGRVI